MHAPSFHKKAQAGKYRERPSANGILERPTHTPLAEAA
jgi:hypothetical protein